MRVEHYRLTDEGWSFEALTRPHDLLRFEVVAFETSLKRTYFGVEVGTVHQLSR